MFCDITTIEVFGGKGGNGSMSFLRAKFLPKGGPDGGDGGQGGSVILQANENLNTLIELHTKKFFSAENGEPGAYREKNGHAGKDIILEVPVGTLVKNTETNEILYDFSFHGEQFIAARGGRGGYGNEHFKSAIRQAPHFAELGEPGEKRILDLELKLVADVGIIGIPSAGKSTLISAISAARPKCAPYPFTTLIPNLGVVRLSDSRSFVACDVPGLIEGAHEGKGLGHEFLRHISRSRIVVHLVDVSRENTAEDYAIIRKELESYSPDLAQKPEIIAFSKADILGNDEELEKMVRESFLSVHPHLKKTPILFISGITQKNIPELLEILWTSIEKAKKEERVLLENITDISERVVFRPHLEEVNPKRWLATVEKNGFRISGKRIEQITIMTNLMNSDAMMRLRDVFRKVGIERELLRIGAVRGSSLFIGEQVIPFEPLLLK